jgi:hypothetical protein
MSVRMRRQPTDGSGTGRFNRHTVRSDVAWACNPTHGQSREVRARDRCKFLLRSAWQQQRQRRAKGKNGPATLEGKIAALRTRHRFRLSGIGAGRSDEKTAACAALSCPRTSKWSTALKRNYHSHNCASRVDPAQPIRLPRWERSGNKRVQRASAGLAPSPKRHALPPDVSRGLVN